MYDLITKDMLPIYIILGASDFAKKNGNISEFRSD